MNTERPGRSLGGKVGRFAVVGIANTAIDLAVFSILLRLSAMPLLSNLISWSVAVVFSFAANSLWTFDRDRGKRVAHSFLQFVSFGALVSLGVSNLSIVLLQSLVGAWPAKVIGTVVAAAINFVAARWSIEGRILGQ